MNITFVFRHKGPGPHPSGTPQAVHAGPQPQKPEVQGTDKPSNVETVYFAKSGSKKIEKGTRPRKGAKAEPQKTAEEMLAQEQQGDVATVPGAPVAGATLGDKATVPGAPVAGESTVAVAKGTKEAKPPLQFNQANTTDEVADYMEQNDIVGQAKLGSLETPQALVLADELGRLTSDLGVVPVDMVLGAQIVDDTGKLGDTPAFMDFDQATGQTRLVLNNASMNALDHEGAKELAERGLRASREAREITIASMEKFIMSQLGADDAAAAMAHAAYRRLKEDAGKEQQFSRYSVDTGDSAFRQMITHEFGHHVFQKANAATEGLTKELGVVYEQMLVDGSIYDVSKYAYTGGQAELFAEMFSMYRGGEKDKLPKYAVQLIQKAISLAQKKESKK